jgi:hypothetical protein
VIEILALLAANAAQRVHCLVLSLHIGAASESVLLNAWLSWSVDA